MRLCFAVSTELSHDADSRRQATNAVRALAAESSPEPAAGKGILRSSRLIMKSLGVMAEASTVEVPRLVKYVALALANHWRSRMLHVRKNSDTSLWAVDILMEAIAIAIAMAMAMAVCPCLSSELLLSSYKKSWWASDHITVR